MKNNSLRKLLIVPAVLVGLVAGGSVVSADSDQVTCTNGSSISAQAADQYQTQNNSNSYNKSASVNDTVNDAKNATTLNVRKSSTGSAANNTSNVTDKPAGNNTVTINVNQNSNTSSTNNYNQYYTQLYSNYSNRHWGYSYNAWHFYENNQEVSNKWIKWGNYWYYLDGNSMAADGVTYVSDDGTFAGGYYCFDVHGHYRTNLWHREYGNMRNPYGPYMYFGRDGRAVNGWQNIGRQWYYFDNHDMVADQVTEVPDDGTFAGGYYCFDKNGHYRTNLWHRQYGNMRNPYGPYMYFGRDGRAVNGWQKIGNYWYYFRDYDMLANVHDVDVQASNGFSEGYYSFDQNGHIIY